jgi:hypothetical protein
MSRRTAAWVAWSVCALSLSIMALGLLLILLGWSAPLPARWYPWTYMANDIIGGLGAPLLGGLIASQRPENPYGWLWLGMGVSFALATFAPVYGTYALVVAPGSLPAPRTLASLGQAEGYAAIIILGSFLFLVFPDGRLPSRHWRPLAWSIVAVGVAMVIVAVFVAHPTEQYRNPIGIGGAVGETIRVLFFSAELLLYGAAVLSALSLRSRYRGAGFDERQQIKWFAYAAAFASAYALLRFFVSDTLYSLLGTIVLGGLYAAIAIAILKHHLYDIDLLINRTLVYGALTVVFAGIFVIIDEVAQELFLAATHQEESWLSVVVSALVIAALSEPLKHRIEHFVDRRIFRKERQGS